MLLASYMPENIQRRYKNFGALNMTNLVEIDKRTQRGQKIVNLIEEQYDIYLESKDAREREYRKQFPLEDQLKKRIVGQLSPIHSVASAIRTSNFSLEYIFKI